MDVFVCPTGLVMGREEREGQSCDQPVRSPLSVEPATEVLPARVSITVTGAAPDAHGVLHLTPDCMTLDALESCINELRDELDVLRAEARRIFTSRTGHA